MLNKLQISIIYSAFSLLVFIIPIKLFTQIGIAIYVVSIILLLFQCRKQTNKKDYLIFLFVSALTIFIGMYIIENTIFTVFNFSFFSVAALLCTFFYSEKRIDSSRQTIKEPLIEYDRNKSVTNLYPENDIIKQENTDGYIQEWEERLIIWESNLNKKFEDKFSVFSESVNEVYDNQNYVIKILQEERESLVSFKSNLEIENLKLEKSQKVINEKFNHASLQLKKEKEKRSEAENMNLNLTQEKRIIIERDDKNTQRIIHLQKALEGNKKGQEEYELIYQELQDAKNKKNMYSQKINEKENEIFYQTQLASQAIEDSEELERKLKNIGEKKDGINKKYKSLLAENDNLRKKIERQDQAEEHSRKNLVKQWEIEYPNFKFESQVIKEFLQFKDVESRALFSHELGKLHYAENPNERNRSKLKSKDGTPLHLGFTTRDNQVYRINYKVVKNQKYKIILTDIYKKGTKKYKQ